MIRRKEVLPLYREPLNTASRCRPSRATELSRAASGLVKVLCKPSDRMPQQPGGKGSKGSKNQQQGKSLVSFKAWFGSLDEHLVHLVSGQQGPLCG